MATPVGPLPVGASPQLILDAIEISILYASVCNLPDRLGRIVFSIADPGHPHPAILDQDLADDLYQIDLFSRANERLVAAIDGSERAIGGPQLFLDAHALRDLS